MVFLGLIAASGSLSGCASYSASAAKGLDKSHAKFETDDCKTAINENVSRHEDIKIGRIVATPTLLLLSGGLALPLLAANTALDIQDQRAAARIKEQCSELKVSNEDIGIEVAKNAAIGIATQGLKILPTGPLDVQPGGK